jgi:hypothetical protein
MFKTPALVLPTLVATQFTLASARMGKHGQSRQLQRAAYAPIPGRLAPPARLWDTRCGRGYRCVTGTSPGVHDRRHSRTAAVMSSQNFHSQDVASADGMTPERRDALAS